jgi:hypothetical protein
LTGGFFLICNLGMLWALGYGPKGIPKELKDLLQSADAPLVAPHRHRVYRRSRGDRRVRRWISA